MTRVNSSFTTPCARNDATCVGERLKNPGIIEELSALKQRIQELEKSESVLRENEYRFRVVREISMEAFTILCCIRDEQGKITDFEWTYANSAAGRILKQQPEKLVGQRLLEVLPGNRENRDLFDRYVRIVETGLGDEVEIEYHDGEISGWFRNMTVKLDDGVAVSFSDITQRKQAEMILQQRKDDIEHLVAVRTSELSAANLQLEHEIAERKLAEEQISLLNERISMATRSAQVGIWDWDVVNDRLTWDDQMYALYGQKKEDFPGAYDTWVKGLHPDDRASSEEETRQVLRDGKDYDTEFRVVWPDGSVRFLKAKGNVIRDANGKPLRVIGVNYDITLSKQAEQALHLHSEIMTNMTEGVIPILIITDLDGELQRNYALSAGADACLTKDSIQTELIPLMNKLLQGF